MSSFECKDIDRIEKCLDEDPVIIKISGPVGSGKSPWARKLEKVITSRELSVFINDHKLFEFDNKYELNFEDAIHEINREQPDIAIVVIGTGVNRGEFKISIDKPMTNPMFLLDLMLN